MRRPLSPERLADRSAEKTLPRNPPGSTDRLYSWAPRPVSREVRSGPLGRSPRSVLSRARICHSWTSCRPTRTLSAPTSGTASRTFARGVTAGSSTATSGPTPWPWPSRARVPPSESRVGGSTTPCATKSESHCFPSTAGRGSGLVPTSLLVQHLFRFHHRPPTRSAYRQRERGRATSFGEVQLQAGGHPAQPLLCPRRIPRPDYVCAAAVRARGGSGSIALDACADDR